MAVGGRRPLAAHVFSIEVELVTAADLGTDTLANVLTQLTTAGLHGMVSRIVSVALDGAAVLSDDAVNDPALVRRVRPPPDPKVDSAIRQVEEALRVLKATNREDHLAEVVA